VTDPGATTGDVPALRKGLLVLELLAEHGSLTMTEIQRRGGLNKTMAFRLLRSLREQGYLRHDPVTHRFSLALKLLELGGAVAAQLDIVSVGQPLIDDLRQTFQETINLGIVDDRHVVYVAMAESSRRGLRMASHVGGRDHLHSTSIGKAILAFLPEDQRDDLLLDLPQTGLTLRTITDPARLRADLAQTQQRGYAIDDEENETGARCVGVPILDGHGLPLAGLSISGPSSRIDGEQVPVMAARLWETSLEISRRLGHLARPPEGIATLGALGAAVAASR
jgi:DNA-binding IclR family transcriptional regulator